MFIHHNEKAFYSAYYSQLVGCTIVRTGLVDEDGEFWPTFTLRRPDGTEFDVELSVDPEGNGPGFLFGLERPA